MAEALETQGLRRVGVQHFRHLDNTQIEPSHGVNVIHGANAAGKTSFLEAIHFLARARSFMTHRSQRLVATAEQVMTVNGQIATPAHTHQLGVQFRDGETRVRLDGRDVQALSESAWLMPVQVINTETQRLLTDGPAMRRAFVNWGVFHVEPAYRTQWRRYWRALKQRNAALKVGNSKLAAAWEPEMASAGEQVDEQRRKFLNTLLPGVMALAGEWMPSVTFDWRFRSGWPKGTALADTLANARERELSQGFGHYGPQRADLRLLADGEDAATRLSRGQQKLLVAALRLGLVGYWAQRSEQRPLLLMDDLPAELDRGHRDVLMAEVRAMPAQSFVTTIEPDQLPDVGQGQWFHVEQGKIRSE